ncbi:MAG: alpha/beta hydrolase [Pseudomonadota bacterium]|nr:alpha/beta hydrolase [Pseudomonadota bacterium]
MEQEITQAPDWFVRAVQTPYRKRQIEVEGCPIHYLTWGETGKPGLLLVHGGGAHAHWWDFIAPFFIDRYSVCAVDLSGMGDSGHRDQYSGDLFAKELMSVCEDAGFGANTVIAGHSFGGLATLKAGLHYANRLSGIVVCDSAIFPPGFSPGNDMRSSPFKEKKTVYPDFESAVARFKLVPPQPCANRYILDYIARHSLMAVEGGWTWKFDMRFLQKTIYDDLAMEVKNLNIPAAMLYGEKSMLFGKFMLENTRKWYADDVPFICLPKARHHLFLDEPLDFVDTLAGIIDPWTGVPAATPAKRLP